MKNESRSIKRKTGWKVYRTLRNTHAHNSERRRTQNGFILLQWAEKAKRKFGKCMHGTKPSDTAWQNRDVFAHWLTEKLQMQLIPSEIYHSFLTVASALNFGWFCSNPFRLLNNHPEPPIVLLIAYQFALSSTPKLLCLIFYSSSLATIMLQIEATHW